MARFFNSGNNEYLSVNSPAITATPLTMACWFKTTTLAAGQSLVWVGNQGNDNSYFALWFAAASNSVAMRTAGPSGGTETAYSVTNSVLVDTWCHACGITSGSASRHAFSDGVVGSENVVPLTPTAGDIDTTAIGVWRRSTDGVYMSGKIAESAIWNVALSQGEISALAAGYSPLCIRPNKLIFYCPLIRDNDNDLIGRLSLVANNTPTISDHPRIIYPGKSSIIAVPNSDGSFPIGGSLNGGFNCLSGGFV